MSAMAVRRTHLIAKLCRPSSLLFIFSLLFVASAQDAPSPLQRQSATDRRMQSRHLRVEQQPLGRIPLERESLQNFRKSRSVGNAEPSAAATQIQLFLDAIPYQTGIYPESIALGDFNNDGKLDLAVTVAEGVSVLLSKRDGTFQAHVDYATGTGFGRVAVGDFNADGKPDLAVTNYLAGNTVSVLLGNGDGTFQPHVDYATGTYALSLAVGDFNRDGITDLAVTNYTGNTVSVLLGNGDGTFQPRLDYGTGASPSSVAAADLNGDGKPDLAVTNYTGNTLSVLLGNGDGTFQPHVDYATGTYPWSLAVGDFNGDSAADLAVTNERNNTVSVLLGNGDGTFQPRLDYATGASPSSVAAADLNGDGKPDLAVTNSDDTTLSVLLGNGDGTFQPRVDYTTGCQYASLALGDLNDDGKPDVAVTNSLGGFVIALMGNEDGTFPSLPSYVAGKGPTSVAAADFNGDSIADLAVGNGGDNSASILLGKGEGTFQTHVDYATGKGPYSLVTGDFNNDGKGDLAVANNSDNSVSILLGKGDGTLQAHVDYATGKGPYSLVTGDFNNDGKGDLAVANNSDNSVSILLGKGDGTLQAHVDYATGKGPYSVVTGDFNNDAALDLAVVGYIVGVDEPHYYYSVGTISILLGNGDGTFRNSSTYTYRSEFGYIQMNPASAAVGDLNGDGKLDLAVSNSGFGNPYTEYWEWGSVGVLLGKGDGSFETEVTYPCCGYLSQQAPSSIAIWDLNGDGFRDLLVTDANSNWVGVLLGNGDGTFQAATGYAGGRGHSAITVADLNSDGASDVAFVTPGKAVGFASFGFYTPGKDVSILFGFYPRGTFIDLLSSTNPSVLGQEVTLKATVRASMNRDGIGTPTGTVTFLDGTEALHSQTLSETGEASFSTAALSQGAHNIRVFYSGDVNFNSHNTGDFVQQVNGPDFALVMAAGNTTLMAGTSADFALTFTGMYGFAGSVSLSCSVSPKPALAPTCAVNPQSVNLASNGSATTKLTIATTGPTASLDRRSPTGTRPLYAVLVGVFSLALLGTASGRAKTKKTIGGMLLVLVLGAATLHLACGGGSSTPPPPPPSSSGTPSGQYSVTVNATSGSITHSTAVTITVQ
jgi:Big-like domain-containing protein/VCBS repeat protein